MYTKYILKPCFITPRQKYCISNECILISIDCFKTVNQGSIIEFLDFTSFVVFLFLLFQSMIFAIQLSYFYAESKFLINCFVFKNFLATLSFFCYPLILIRALKCLILIAKNHYRAKYYKQFKIFLKALIFFLSKDASKDILCPYDSNYITFIIYIQVLFPKITF